MHRNARVIVDGLARLPEFAHATRAGDLLFVSGTLGTKGDTFEMVPGGVGPETTQILSNIERILASAGLGLDDVVKVSVFMTDLADFGAMNAAYSQFSRTIRHLVSPWARRALPWELRWRSSVLHSLLTGPQERWADG